MTGTTMMREYDMHQFVVNGYNIPASTHITYEDVNGKTGDVSFFSFEAVCIIGKLVY